MKETDRNDWGKHKEPIKKMKVMLYVDQRVGETHWKMRRVNNEMERKCVLS